MIDLVNKTVTLTGRAIPITSFAVWHVTPWGIMTNLEEAVNRCLADDMNPNEVIRSISVAVAGDTYEMMR
jgi:hypothetical protein